MEVFPTVRAMRDSADVVAAVGVMLASAAAGCLCHTNKSASMSGFNLVIVE